MTKPDRCAARVRLPTGLRPRVAEGVGELLAHPAVGVPVGSDDSAAPLAIRRAHGPAGRLHVDATGADWAGQSSLDSFG